MVISREMYYVTMVYSYIATSRLCFHYGGKKLLC